MRRADGLALAAAQAALDGLRDGAEARIFENEGLRAEELERGRVGALEAAARHELALVEAALGVDSVLPFAEGTKLLVGDELELREADAVLARNDAV